MKTEATKQGDNLDVAKVVRDKVKKVTRKKKKPSSTAKAKRTFPLFDIEESRKIPDVIKQLNAGNPWDPKDIAAAIGMAMANNFYYLSASSRDYGLTLGTRDTEKIELSELGKKLVYPKSALAESEAIQEAFRHVELFKKVFDYYQGENLPDIQYLKNTLKTEFGVDEKFQDAFYEIYQKNLTYLKSKGAMPAPAAPTIDTKGTSGSIILGESSDSGKLASVARKKRSVFREASGLRPCCINC